MGGGPPLLWVKKEEMTEGRKAGLTSKKKKSGSATGKDSENIFLLSLDRATGVDGICQALLRSVSPTDRLCCTGC